MHDFIDIIVQFINDNSFLFYACLVGIMLYAAHLEWKSIQKKAFKDYKPIIISIAILGTFIGIFCGLWGFETKDITGSVPRLLDGLKLAFSTSILGMFFSVVMSFIENRFVEEINKDLSVNNSNESLNMEVLRDILKEQKEANKKTSLIHDSIHRSGENINKHFIEVNESLKKALSALSKGATEEIITALEKVISDFNKNLTEQFGDNFKQLNESVKNMIVWQENYKFAIEQVEENLRNIMESLKTNAEYSEKLRVNFEKISKTSQDLSAIIESNENQIKNLETHMSNLKKIGDDAGLITASINNFSKSIQGSLSNQSEGLNKLSAGFEKQLEVLSKLSAGLQEQLSNSLGNLNTALTALTDKFKNDYKEFLEYMKKIKNDLK